jgi:hypothetical protein
MTTIRVTQLITDVDMRPTRALIDGRLRLFSKLSRGQIALLVNRACTMARFIDCEKTIHTMYAGAGEKFDLATIENMVKKRTLAIGVDVVRNPKVKARRVVSMARERKSA